MVDDPGAIDNRLSLNPDDFPVIQDWVDGETYTLSELGSEVEIRQISPGEFEVVVPVKTAEEASEEVAEEMPQGRTYRGTNPAVENLVARNP